MSEQAEPRAAQLQLDASPAPEAEAPAPIYSNFVQANFVPENFTLYFGWYAMPTLDQPPPEGLINVRVQPAARVQIPLNLMRNLIALLQLTLDNYETNFGAIPEHPNKPVWLKEAEGGA